MWKSNESCLITVVHLKLYENVNVFAFISQQVCLNESLLCSFFNYRLKIFVKQIANNSKLSANSKEETRIMTWK